MKKISYRHKKVAAEKDLKDLNNIYFKVVKKDAESSLEAPPGDQQESRREYFQRLNQHILENTEKYDEIGPFSRESIEFVGRIPESELETLSKKDRLDFVKWIASNYLDFKQIFTLENVSKIRSLIDSSANYSFSDLANHSPAHYIQELTQSADEAAERAKESVPIEEAIASNLKVDSALFSSASEIVNGSDIASILSDREKAFLKLGAALTDKVDNLTLIFDFISSENSDIEIKKASDLEALYSFDLNDKESIIVSFNSLDQNQHEWHETLASNQEGAEGSGGKYGYGYETNIVVHQFDDGWKVVYLPSNEDSFMVPWKEDSSLSHDRIQEGDNNGLCLGSGSKLYNDSQSGYIYSLRTPANKPVATIRTKADLINTKDFSNEYVYFHEIREKNNKDLGIEASIYLDRFFKSVNIWPSSYDSYIIDTNPKALAELSSAFTGSEGQADSKSEKEISDLFDWIYFLNKKRSSRKESQKYKEYLSYYNDLVSARSLLFNSDDGRFLRPTSFERDESRARKYTERILKKIKELSSGSFLDNSFVESMFGGSYNNFDSSTWEKLYKRILSKIPEYKDALPILAEEFPVTVYNAACRSSHALPQSVKNIALISAEKLLDGEAGSLDDYFKRIFSWGGVFFDPIIFSEKYKRKSVIEYLENYYSSDRKGFLDRNAHKYYYGDKSYILQDVADNISGKISEEISKRKAYAKELDKTKNIISSIAIGDIESLLKYSEYIEPDIIFEAIEMADEHLHNAMQTDEAHEWKVFQLFERYYMLRSVAKNKFLIDTDSLKVSEDEILSSILENKYLKFYGYTDPNQTGKSLAENFKRLMLFNPDNKIVNTFKEKIKEKISSFKEDPSSPVSIIALKKSIDAITLDGFSFFDDISEEIRPILSEDALPTFFTKSPDMYFKVGLHKDPEYSHLSEDLISIFIDKLFYVDKYFSEYIFEANKSSLSSLLEDCVGNDESISSIVKKIDANIDSVISEISKLQSIPEEKSYEQESEYKEILAKFRNATYLLSGFDEQKSLAKEKRALSNKLSGSKEAIENAIKKDPSIFYEYKLQDIKWLNIDRRKAALSYIHKMLLEKSRGYGEEKNQFADMIIADLGLPKQASILSRFFVKNSYFNEFYSLAKLFVNN